VIPAVVEVAEDVAAASGDMAAYVGLLFDSFVRNPENARLHDWLSFGGVAKPEGSLEVLAMKRKLDDIRAGQEVGHDSRWDPAQLLIMLIEITKSMAHPKDSALHQTLLPPRSTSRAAVGMRRYRQRQPSSS